MPEYSQDTATPPTGMPAAHVEPEAHNGQRIDEMDGEVFTGQRHEDDEPIYHYLLNFTAAGEVPRSEVLATELAKGFPGLNLKLLMATTYVSKIAVDPREIGIVNAWSKIPEREKNYLLGQYPGLVTAIDMICGVGRPPAGQASQLLERESIAKPTPDNSDLDDLLGDNAFGGQV